MIPLRDTQPSHSFPFVTILLIVLNALVFFLDRTMSPWERNAFIFEFGTIPVRFQYTDLITSMFLHGGWMHFLGNMLFLWVFGDNVEDVLGHAKYLLFYLASGLAAGLLHVFTNSDSVVPAIGASGAIAGVMGAYLVKFPHSRIVMLVPIFVFLTTFEIPAAFVLVYWFVIQLFSGVGSYATTAANSGGTAWFAHIGGFLAGIVLIFLLGTNERYRRRRELYW